MKDLTISKLSQRVGLPPKTIRFYEEEGVISPAKRAENGYRVYDDVIADELTLIKQARDLGLPLSEIKKLIKGCENDSCNHTENEVLADINQYIELLTIKIHQFTNLKQKLQQLQTHLSSKEYSCDESKYCCNFLYQLTQTEKGGEKV